MKSKSLQRLTASVFFRTLCIVAGIAMSAAALQAHAASASGNLGVSASVSQKCTVAATGITFSNYDAVGTNATADLTGEGSLSVKCTKGSSGVNIALDNGLNYASSTRNLKSTATPADVLAYNIYQPSATTDNAACPASAGTVWDATNKLTPSVTWSASTGATFRVCGRVASGQDAAVHTDYADTVGVTVNF